MAPTNNPAFTQATDRVRALRKGGVSENSLAKTIGVSRTAVRTIMNRGAHHTRGETKRRVLKWVSVGARGPAAIPKPGRPPVRSSTPSAVATPASPTRRRRRRRRRGAVAAVPVISTNHVAPAVTNVGFAHVELEDGRLVRLTVGSQYILHKGRLLRAL
jgi:hypothetical protein